MLLYASLITMSTMMIKIGIDAEDNVGKSVSTAQLKLENNAKHIINNTNTNIVKMVSDEFEQLKNDTVKMYTTTEVNIREFASVDSKRISTVGINTEIIVYKNFNVDEWRRVKYNGNDFYICSKYLSNKPIEIKKEVKTSKESKSNKSGKLIGRFKITHYAGDGITSTGTKPTVGRTIAVDPRVIPYGSKVIINGHTYIAEDCGGAIKGNIIDLFVGSTEEAYQKGVYYTEIYWG